MTARRKTTSEGAGRVPALRAIGYVRVSTRGQAERGMSLETQRERIDEYARAKGYELLETVQEAASGAVANGELFSWEHRPALLELRERASRGEYDVLVVARFDRLSRDYATLIETERKLERYGARVESVAEENGDGPVAEYLRGNLALIAELERGIIRQRVSAGKAKKKQLGRHVHGRVPYGYVTEKSPGVLEPDEPDAVEKPAPLPANASERDRERHREQRERFARYENEKATAPATIVRRIFEDARDGYTPGRIANGLNADAIPSPSGGTWNRTAVRGILENRAYLGERYGVKRAHKPIVGHKLWNAANQQLASRARR